jgi:hypothetical protein
MYLNQINLHLAREPIITAEDTLIELQIDIICGDQASVNFTMPQVNKLPIIHYEMGFDIKVSDQRNPNENMALV